MGRYGWGSATRHVRAIWETLRTSLWFIPSLMVMGAAVLAFVLVDVDRSRPSSYREWLYSGGADGAREVLGTIASSMVGTAGVAFSITIVALSLASQQLGPRLLRSFMRDRGNQFVLGTFVATFVYCILVLRTVRGGDEDQFVPNIGVTVGVVLAVISLGVLIYFIHHMSVLIQAPTVIVAVAHDLECTIDELFPESVGEEKTEEDSMPEPPDFTAADDVGAAATGYVQTVDADSLLELATRHELVVRLSRRPGHFVMEGSEVLRVYPPGRLDKGMRRDLARAVSVGEQRSPAQDVEFAVQQLVEVALRALSPSSNDPFTAIACIERLGDGLRRLGCRRIPSPCRCDAEGAVRLIAYPVTHAGLVEAAFNQIRENAGGHVAVTIRLLETIAEIGRRPVDRRLADALLRQTTMIERGARKVELDPSDRDDIVRRVESARGVLANRLALSGGDRGQTSPASRRSTPSAQSA